MANVRSRALNIFLIIDGVLRIIYGFDCRISIYFLVSPFEGGLLGLVALPYIRKFMHFK